MRELLGRLDCASVPAVSRGADEDGRRAARIVALTMGLLFSLIFVLHAMSS
jgi:hypothetical protein